LGSTRFPRVLWASIVVLVALLTVAPAVILASDLGHTDLDGKGLAHGSLGKLPWASAKRAFLPSLDLVGPALCAEQFQRLPVIPDFSFVPPRS
jgi:hypothetical protein